MKRWLSQSGNSGAGLIDAMITLSVMAAGAIVLMNMLHQGSRLRRAVELKAEARQLKKILLTSTDCRAVPACQNNELRTLTDYEGQVLVKDDGSTRVGSWTVRAQCQADHSLEVRAALLDAHGQAVRDPLRKKLMDWDAAEAVLIEPGILCAGGHQGSAGSLFTLKMGPVCTPAQGTCPPPLESRSDAKAPKKMCCDDGRDTPKPECPASTQEFAAYWDRQGDWGASGQWVVLCQ